MAHWPPAGIGDAWTTVERTTGTLAVVVNPRVLHGPAAGLWEHALARLSQCGAVECLHTAGDGADVDRVATLLAARPSLVIAAGGDGTVHEAVAACMAAEKAPALAILPFGTANNVARSLGLPSVRAGRPEALERALAAIVDGSDRLIDLGCVGSRVFLGSFAVGMDGVILAARNRWRRRWHLGPRIGGYPLYLLSCAVNLARHRAVSANLTADGAPWDGPIYDLLVINTALYAGEFCFDDADHSSDGRLDLQVFRTAADYVRAFVTAWRRHLRRERGLPVQSPPQLRRVANVELTLSQPVPYQIDGEESAPAECYSVRVLPRALRVRVP
jgi:diacylglycerol kinase family enzyme